jgi:hypothetical protein
MSKSFTFEEALGQQPTTFSFEEVLGTNVKQTAAEPVAAPTKQEATAPTAGPGSRLGAVAEPVEPTEAIPTPKGKTTTLQRRGYQLVPEQFMSGLKSLGSSQLITQAKNNQLLLNVLDRVENKEPVSEAEDTLGFQHMSPKQRADIKAKLEAAIPPNLRRAAVLETEKMEYARSAAAENMTKLANAGKYGDAWKAFSSNPGAVIQQFSVESTPNMLPSLVGGAAGLLMRGGVGAMMAGMATGSFPMEYAASIMESLDDAGVDPKNPRAVDAKLRDPAFLKAAGDRAFTRAGIIATMDALGGGMLLPFKKGQVAQNIARGAANLVIEPSTEAGGEALAQAATGEFKLGDIAAEALGAGPSAVIGTGLRTAAQVGEDVGTRQAERPEPPSVYERIEPTFGATQQPASPAETRVEPTFGPQTPITPEPPVSAPPPDVERRVQEIMATLPVSEVEARAIAEAEVKRKLAEVDEVITKAPPVFQQPPVGSPEEERLLSIYNEFIDGGFPPEQAESLAREQFANEQAEIVEEPVGEKRAGEAVDATGGVGAGVAGVPGTVAPTGGVTGTEPTGVVPPSTDVEQPAGGTAAEPVAVTKTAEELEAEAEDRAAAERYAAERTAALPATNALVELAGGYGVATPEQIAQVAERFGITPDKLEGFYFEQGELAARDWNRIDAEDSAAAERYAAERAAAAPAVNALIDLAGGTEGATAGQIAQIAERFDMDPGALENFYFDRAEEGTTDGTQAPQAQQAETQGQKEPAADATTPAATEVTDTGNPLLIRDTTPSVTKRGRGRPRKEATAQPAEGETAPKGKRGRPALDRTPEQKQKVEADKAERKSIAQMVDYHLKKLVEQLKSVPDMVKDFTPSVDFPTAQDFQDYVRANIAAGVLRLMRVPGVKGTAAYKRAKAVFDGPQFTDTNREDAEIILKGEAQIRERASDQETYGQDESGDEDSGASSARSRELIGDVLYGAGPVNPDLLTATTAEGALNAIIRRGTIFQRFLARRLQGLVGGIQVIVVREGFRPPDHLVSKRMWDNSVGIYSDPGKVIYLRAPSTKGDRQQGVNNVIALHELLHAATVRKIRLAMASTKNTNLKRAVNNVIRAMALAENTYNRLGAVGRLSQPVVQLVETLRRRDGQSEIFSNPAEFVSYGLTDPDFQIFLMRAVVGKIKSTPFKQFVSALMDMFGIGPQDTNAFKDLVLSTGTILRARLSPEMLEIEARGDAEELKSYAAAKQTPPSQQAVRSQKEINADYKKALTGLQQSRASDLHKSMSMFQRMRDEGKVLPILKDKYDNASYKGRRLLADLVTFDFLGRWFKKEVPAVQDTYNIVQQMLGHINELNQSAIDQVRMLVRDVKGNPQLEQDVTDLIQIATVMRIDPSKRFARERSPDLDARYQALGDKGRAIYKRVIDYHESLRGYMEFLLNKQIEDLPGLDPAVKENMLAKIYAMFAEQRRIEPYVPLTRDPGKFFLLVGKENPQVYFYESREDRASDARRIAREQYNTDDIEMLQDDRTFYMGNDPKDLRSRIDLQGTLLSELFNAVDSSVVPGESAVTINEDLKSAMFDIWLTMMPEQGFRKHFHERKGRAGYRVNIGQNIAAHITGMAPALSRLRYGQQLRAQRVRFTATEEKYHPVRDSVLARIDAVMRPNPRGFLDAFAGLANKFTYLTYLTGAMTAFVQPSGLVISGIPILSANHKANPAQVGAEVARAVLAMRQYGITRKLPNGEVEYVAPSLVNSQYLTGDEKAAVQAMAAMNVATQTYSGFLWDAAQGEANIPSATPTTTTGKAVELGKKTADVVINGLLRNTERLTREALYLASYRIGRSKGLTHEQAVMQAAADVKESLGDYDLSSKPKWMQHPVGRVAFSMKMYPVVVMQQLFGSLARALPLLNKEGKTQAITKFAGITMSAAVVAGVYNMPFADLIITALTKFLDDLDDEDLPAELKDIDPVTWFKTVWMPQTLGQTKILDVPLDRIIGEGALSAFTNVDIGRRIGLNDLWFRDGKPSATVPEAVGSFMMNAFGGPLLSYGQSAAKGIQSALIGDYQKAFEQTVPLAPARNLAVAKRVAEEGYATPKGVLVPPEKVTKGEIFRQALGAVPADVAAAREASFKLTGAEQQIVNKRDLIARRFKHAYEKQKFDLLEKVIGEEIPKFNARHPEYKVTPDQLARMAQTMQEQKGRAVSGVPFSEKNVRTVGEAAATMQERLQERLQERK